MSPHRALLAAVSWTILIVAACSIPGTDLPDVDVASVDKLAHFSMFAVFAWLWLHSLESPLAIRYLVVIVGGTVFGGLTEIYQGMLPWERTPDLGDAVANTIGLLAGSAFFAFYQHRRLTRTGNE